MKPVLPTFLLVFLLLAGCNSLPRLRPHEDPGITPSRCLAPFATEKFQLVHAISATLPGGGQSLVTGVTTIVPWEQSVHAVLMTLEGLILFEGRYRKGKTEIIRSIPPFSNDNFARGLLDDVRLVFLPPETDPVQTGLDSRDYPVCRYRHDDGRYLDIIFDGPEKWRLIQYGSDFTIQRQVVAGSGRPFPGRIELTAPGTIGYRLHMKLVRKTIIP